MIKEVINSILERYINNSSASKEWSLAADGYLPLTPTIMREFSEDVELAYHVTDEEGLKGLKKIQGQKKEISTFKRGGSGIALGARREAKFLVELSGKSSFNADKDFGSELSRNGYKWLNPISTEKEYVVNNKFSVPMKKKMVKYFRVKNRFGIVSAVTNLDGKGKQKFIKWYFDEAKKMINKKLIEEIRVAIGKKNRATWSSDEYFLGEIKIKGVKIILHGKSGKVGSPYPIEYPEREELIEKLGLKFSGYISRDKVEKIDIN